MRALISVSDKTGVVDFAKGLRALGWEVIATGGTMKLLADSGVEVINISDVTGFPEICDGRVKTLHPMVHGGLLAKRDNPQHMAEADPEEIYPYIKSISYPNNKARNLAGMARMLCSEFGGEVPSDLQQMQRLPGVGRKTANVLGAVLWQKEVMPVDTHVFRVSERIGLTTRSKTPLQTELTLEKNIPGHLLPLAHHWLILHGRYVCMARSPKCGECGIAAWCRKYAADHKAPKD